MWGRLNVLNCWIKLGGLDEMVDWIMVVNCFIIVVCGIFWYFGLIVEYLFEDLVRILVEVEYVFEFCYWNFIIILEDVVIVIL